ncbi:N-acetyltransferase [Paenibacillus sp. 1011MAR3C5]|uniref:GNAT family N-acetyltransferase n=1 Tax=Paenibacillus sp. 1011MAR3C5 TaxID=1675787 RepID=UPI000E6D08D1|nr:GNAT family protein [Paenibacillus sp. 1011MAR3C5]RJE87427.1 N-acetyltransferase [Paenibacillus sp. 1011MAR3C5]
MSSVLHTERLYLRKMEVSDSASLFEIWSDPDVTRFMNIDQFTDEAQAKEMIQFLNNLSEDDQAIRFTIIEKESGQIIGSGGYNFLDMEHAKAEIGYDLAKAYWGRGYATEAIGELLEYAFTTLMLNRIEAKVEPENVNSIKVLQKLNFTYEGTLRQYEKIKGMLKDISIYSKLAAD